MAQFDGKRSEGGPKQGEWAPPRPPRPLFLFPGVVAALCAPGILLAERLDWPESPFHVTQLLACLLCLPLAALYLLVARRRRAEGAAIPPARMVLAWLAAMLTAGWLAFIAFVILSLSFSDF